MGSSKSETNHRYRERNPEEYKKRQKENQRRYRESHPQLHKRDKYVISRKKSIETWNKNYPEKKKHLMRSHHLKKYGLTIEEYDRLLVSQNGVCAICRKTDSTHRLCVDHDHITGKVRGLLCGKCNRGIGCLGDNSMQLRMAADYIEKSK